VTRDAGVTLDIILTITDPHYRGRVLVVHADLSKRDAAQLVAVYRALGYPEKSLHQTPVVGRLAA
jgi:hypothetical protein